MKKRFVSVITTTVLFSFIFSLNAFAGQWHQDSNGWWYQTDDSHYYANGIQKIDGAYYLFDADGYMMTGWHQTTGGDWYYAYDNGIMATNTWVGDYYLGENGVMVPNKKKSGFTENWIYGEYQNKSSAGYSNNHYVDLQINYDKTYSSDGKADFGLYDITGTGKSLYDKNDPNGDRFTLVTADGRTYRATSEITGESYTLKYDGDGTIILYWKGTSWMPDGGRIVLEKVMDSNLDILQSGNGVG